MTIDRRDMVGECLNVASIDDLKELITLAWTRIFEKRDAEAAGQAQVHDKKLMEIMRN